MPPPLTVEAEDEDDDDVDEGSVYRFLCAPASLASAPRVLTTGGIDPIYLYVCIRRLDTFLIPLSTRRPLVSNTGGFGSESFEYQVIDLLLPLYYELLQGPVRLSSFFASLVVLLT